MNVFTLDPLKDDRWAEFIGRHESSSIFHTAEWLEAIRRTYGYRPVVYTTSEPSCPLSNGIVFCKIKSWLTGKRMVSLPFSDHCEPLLDATGSADAIAGEIDRAINCEKLNYVEIRPQGAMAVPDGAMPMEPSVLHLLDLSPNISELLKQTHRSSIRGAIKKAESEELKYECGNSEELLSTFYRLMLLTRRRHQIPPQPILWFRNLIACLGDRLKIRVAFKDSRAIASLLTLQFKGTVYYKYACSDSEFNKLCGMPFLYWKTIVEAKSSGLTTVDFGRSDRDNPGLILFKDRWGAKSSPLVYFRWSRTKVQDIAKGRSSGAMKRLFAAMPDSLLETTGRILYRHMG